MNGAGQAATALSARPGVVLASLVQQSPILLCIVAPPLLCALLEGAWPLAWSLAPQCGLLVIGSLLARRFGRSIKDLRTIEAISGLAAIFVLACALSVPSFIALGMDPVSATFEAVSGITSTGLSVAAGFEEWPISAHLYRGWLQWCGGFAIAYAGVAVLLGPGGAARTVGETTLQARDSGTSGRIQARDLLTAYVGLTVIAIAGCLFLIPVWWEALAVALAAASTGGFAPRGDSLASYSEAAQVFTIAICVISAVSFLYWVRLLRGVSREDAAGGHSTTTLTLIFGGAALYGALALFVGRVDAESPDVAWLLLPDVLNFISGITTAGFAAGPIAAAPPLVLVLVIFMIIGGDVGSSAGGLKVSRIVVLFKMIGLAILRVRVPPQAVTHLRDHGVRLSPNRIIALGSLLMLYLGSLGIFWLVFLMSGAAPLPALFEVASALSTVGLSSGLTGADMTDTLKITLILAMLLGRLEFLALIVLILPRTWF